MPLSRRIARPLLASNFVVGGLDAVRSPTSKADRARSVTEPVRDQLPAAGTLDTETMVRVNGAVQVVAGVLLAVGKFRRLACLALMGSIVPTTYAGHRFWEESDDATRKQQMMQFFKNVGLLGGLILAAVDTEGAPSLSWRAKRRLPRDRGRGGFQGPTRHRREITRHRYRSVEDRQTGSAKGASGRRFRWSTVAGPRIRLGA